MFGLGINIGLGLGDGGSGSSSPQYSGNFFSDTLPTGMTLTRASPKTDWVNGILTDYAIDVPAISTYNGLLVEEARTNSIRNGEAQGATVGVIGSGGVLPTNWNDVNTVGLTREIVGFSTINGVNYLDIKVSGTPSAGTYELLFDGASQIAAASGQIWASSFFIGLVAGSLTGITTVACRTSERNLGVELAGTSQPITPTINPTRVFSIRTLNNAATTAVINEMTLLVTAVAIDATFRIAAVQCELGNAPTSYIRTTTTAVTRARDIPSLPVASVSGFSLVQGTYVAAGKTAYGFGVSDQHLFAATAGSDFIRSYRAAASFQMRYWIFDNGATLAQLDAGGVIATNTTTKVAIRYQTNNYAESVNGGAVSSSTTNSGVPTYTSIDIGRNDTTGYWNNYLHSFAYYNTAKSNAELQVLSA